MRARLEFGDGATAADLVLFRSWLGRTPAVAEAGLRFEPGASGGGPPASDGSMSAGDVIILTCDAVAALASAVSAYAAWRSTRPHSAPLVITVDGRMPLVFLDGSAAEIKRLDAGSSDSGESASEQEGEGDTDSSDDSAAR